MKDSGQARSSHRSLHRHVAEALELSGEADAQTLVEHWLGAGDEKRAARCARLAAEQAMTALAFDQAAQFFAKLLVLGGVPAAERSKVQERLGDALAHAGRGVESADAYIAAIPSDDTPRALELERRAGEQLMRAGHYGRGMTTLTRVLSKLGVSVPRHWWSTVLSLLGRRAMLAFESLRAATAARRNAGPSLVVKFDAIWSVAFTRFMIDVIGAAELHGRCRALALRSRDKSMLVRSEAMETLARLAFQGLRSRESIERGFTALESRVIGDTYLSAIVLFARTVSAHMFGQYPTAILHAKEAEVLLARCGRTVGYEASSVHLTRLWCLFYLGEYAELSHRTLVLARDAHERGDRYAEDVMSTGLPGFSWLLKDDPDSLRAHGQAGMSRGQLGYRDYTSFWHAMSCLWASVYEDRFDDAQAHVARLRRAARPWLPGNPPMVLLELWYLTGSVAVGRSAQNTAPDNALLRLAERNSRKISKLPIGPVKSIAHILRSAVVAQRGDTILAAALLRRACKELCEVAGYRAAAQWRLGELIGGDEGAELLEQASAFFHRQGARNPPRLVATLAPGFSVRERLLRE